MLRTQPWKLVAIGAMTVVGGAALLSTHWSAKQLAAYLALFLAARGMVHWVASPGWVGLGGAAVLLLGGGELAVGLALLTWPDPTPHVIAVIAGAWLLLYGVAAATIAVTTRTEERVWRTPLAAALMNAGFGVTLLLVERNGTIGSISTVLGVLAVVEGAFEILVDVRRRRSARRGAVEAAMARNEISVGEQSVDFAKRS